MLFSVIIPCYNCVKTLETTVESIRASGLPDYEIVLVDDGSTEGTAELCDTLCGRYTEIRCVHQPNAGVSAARNRGIDEAEGEYIWFVDADDKVSPLNIEPILKAIRDGIDCIMFGMRFLYVHHGRVVMRENMSCSSLVELTQQNLGSHFRALFEKNYFTTMCNKFIRRSILAENQIYFDSNLINYEDLHFSLILAGYCKTIMALPETYYCYFNEFGNDHTIDRVQRIPDVIAYTDKVVAPFYALNEQLGRTGCLPIEGLSEIIFRLYMEAAYFKLKTADNDDMKRLCAAVQQSKNIHKEVQSIEKLSVADQRLYGWMMNNSYRRIRFFMRYRALRSGGSRIYRLAKCYLGDKYEKENIV